MQSRAWCRGTEPPRVAAVQLQQFLQSLPPLETERHRLRRELVPLLGGQGRGVKRDDSKAPQPTERDPGRDRER